MLIHHYQRVLFIEDEQKTVLKAFLSGKYALTLLTTGFSESLIYPLI